MRPRHRTTRLMIGSAVCVALWVSGSAWAQGRPVDRGTADFGPHSASQRVVEPGIARFSAEGALVDRYASQPVTRLAELYHQPDVERRYLYQAPGVAALYNQSDYLTRDGQGVVGINRSNAGSGRVYAIAPADVVYVLSPELLDARPTREPAGPVPGQVDRRMVPTATQDGPGLGRAGGQLDTRIDGHVDTARPRIVDVQAIHEQYRGAQRDPRLVERARRWREAREREQAARAAEGARAAGAQPGDEEASDASDTEGAADGAGGGGAASPEPAAEPGAGPAE